LALIGLPEWPFKREDPDAESDSRTARVPVFMAPHVAVDVPQKFSRESF